MKQLSDQAAVQFGKNLAALSAAGQDLPLPAVPGAFVFMNAGWRMAITFPELRKVGIYNLGALKFDGFIDVKEGSALIASGGTVLAIYQPLSRVMELYDTSTLQKRMSQVLPGTEKIKGITMGLHQPMHIFALVDRGGTYQPALIRLPGLMIQECAVQSVRAGYHPFLAMGETVDTSMDETGSFVSACSPTVSPTSLATYTLQPDGAVLADVKHQDARYPRPTLDGRLSITNDGIFGAEEKIDLRPNHDNGKIPIYMTAPVVGYEAFVSLVHSYANPKDFTGFRVSSLANNATLLELPVDKKTLDNIPGGSFRHRSAIMASAQADRLVCIGLDAKRMFVMPLGLRSGTSSSELAEPGKLFEKKVTLPAGSTATLENGPPGLTFDATTHTIKWQVPATQARGQSVQVLLLLKKADGSQDYQIERVAIP